MNKTKLFKFSLASALALLAHSAAAQTAVFTGNAAGEAATDGLVITPAAGALIGNVVDSGADAKANVVPTTSVVDPVSNAITTTIVNQVGSWEQTYAVVSTNNAVTIDVNGITLDEVTTTSSTVNFDVRVTEVTVNDGLGTPSSITSIFTAQAVDDKGNPIDNTLSATGTSEANAYTNLRGTLDTLAANAAVLDEVTTTDTSVPTGGDLTVGGSADVDGVLSVAGNDDPDADPVTDDGYAAVDNVAQAIGQNTADTAANATGIATLNGGADTVGSVDSKVAALESGAVLDNAEAITTLNDNAAVAGSVDAKIAGALNADALAANEEGIGGIITRNTVTGEIHIGENSLITNEVGGVQELYAQDGAAAAININVTNGSDLLIDGVSVATDADVAAATAAFQAADANLQSQISKNKKDIEQNTRGIAMVAALQHTTVLPGMNNAFDLSAAHFEGETGMALNYARRINENVQINFGAASTTDFDESVIKAGIGVQW